MNLKLFSIAYDIHLIFHNTINCANTYISTALPKFKFLEKTKALHGVFRQMEYFMLIFVYLIIFKMDVSPDNTSAVVVNQYLLNPMLLRDVTSSSLYPAEFHQLILENSTSNSCELLLLTLHTLLLEGGFTSLICKSAEVFLGKN